MTKHCIAGNTIYNFKVPEPFSCSEFKQGGSGCDPALALSSAVFLGTDGKKNKTKHKTDNPAQIPKVLFLFFLIIFLNPTDFISFTEFHQHF